VKSLNAYRVWIDVEASNLPDNEGAAWTRTWQYEETAATDLVGELMDGGLVVCVRRPDGTMSKVRVTAISANDYVTTEVNQ
jgi:hypothetical protein